MWIRIGDIECPGSGVLMILECKPTNRKTLKFLPMWRVTAGKQFYEIQADKSATVVRSHGRSSDGPQVSITMDSEEIPVVESSTHLGLKRSSGFNDTITDTVHQSITKAMRTMYSLLLTGLHGEPHYTY